MNEKIERGVKIVRTYKELVDTAQAALKKHDYTTALKLMEACIQIRGEDPETTRNLGMVLNLVGRSDEAEAYYRKSSALANEPIPPSGSMESVDCPLCGSSASRKVWVGRTSEAYAGVIGVIDPIKVWVQCCQCQLTYANPRPSDVALKRHYATFYSDPKNGIWSQTDPERGFLHIAHYDDVLRELERLSAKGRGRFLEVGSGIGYLLAVAVQRGWETVGLELDAQAAAFSRATFGVSVLEEDIESYEFAPGDRYDAVAMCELIEHVRSPVTLLKKVARVLEPRGIMLISTPDRDHPFHALLGPIDPMWEVPSHLTYWSQKSLQYLFSKVGLERLDMRTSTLYLGSTHIWARRNCDQGVGE